MGEIMTRTPELIAAEINTIKEQAREVFCRAAIEIGRRLYEVRALVPHGGWGKWLEANVDYSERTAQNLMRVYEEYGRNANPQAIAGLSFTQAVILLGLDRETRAELMESTDVPAMSTRELQATVDQINAEIESRQVTLQQLIDAETNIRQAEQAEEARAAAEEARASAEDAARRMQIERDDARRIAETARKQAEDAVARANQTGAENVRLKAELQAEREKPEPLPEVQRVEVLPPEVEAELERLRSAAKSGGREELVQVRAIYARAFEELQLLENHMEALAESLPEEAARYRRATVKALRMMADRME